jgi:putative hydrolase of the HAD superfamily
MSTVFHYSFDLWYTLIKSNPKFKKERAHYFFTNFNSLNKSIDEIELVFKSVDLMSNAINEKTGDNISAEEMYLMVIYMLNDGSDKFEMIDLNQIYQDLELLFFKFHPVLFDENTRASIEKIKADKNVTLNILSNTAFIKGVTLRKLLKLLDVERFFDFQLYSDEENYSKPSPNFFDKLILEIKKINPALSLDQIIHIGDNPIADVQGALNKGIQALLINSNDKTIKDLIY